MIPVAARHGYPAPRCRGPIEGPRIAERFDRYESTPAEVASIDTDADALVCSGKADMFILSARTAGALFTLTDRTAREGSTVAILAGNTEQVRIRADVVRVRSLVAGAASAVSVTACYAAVPTGGEGDERPH